MPTNAQFDRAKLKAAILHICALCPPDRLGAVKLHKVLYFADMIRYAQMGHPLTGAQYRKRPFGPTCVPLLPVLRELEQSGEIEVNEVDYFGLRKKEYRSTSSAVQGILSVEELKLLDEVIEFVCMQNTAKTISDFSHQAPWERADFGEEIPYTTAYLLFPSIVSEEAFDVTAKGFEGFEAQGQSANAVVFTDFGAFSNRVRQAGNRLSI